MPLKTCPSHQLLQRFVDGRCSRSEREDLSNHMQSCHSCSQMVQILRGGTADPDREADDSRGAGSPAAVETVRNFGGETPMARAADSAFVSSARAADAAPDPFNFLAASPKPGELGRLGQYAILKMLGEGGMGIVFQARDTNLDRLVALKVLRPEAAANEQSRKRFVQEAKIVASLHHDHIITIFQVGEERGLPFFAMQLLHGVALDHVLKEQGRLSIPDVVRIGREVAEGLAVAHARNLMHRDIKPANIWLEQAEGQTDYRVKILDFGLARSVTDNGQHLTRTGVIMGTPGYMAPEQARSVGADHRSDLFSLGCVLYHACAGQEPFAGEDVMAVLIKLAMEEPPPITDINPEAPYYLVHLIERMMAKDPQQRPESAAEVASILGTAQRTIARATSDSIFMPPTAAEAAEERAKPSAPAAGKPPGSAPRVPGGRSTPPMPTPANREAPATASKPALPGSAILQKNNPAPAVAPKPKPQLPPVEDDMTGPCPRCGAPRSGKASRGWCLSCGYHPELKEEEVVEEGAKQAPLWPWVLGFGVFLIVALSFAAHFLLRPDSLPRARWGSAQLAIGVVFLFLAQIWAWLYIFDMDKEASLFAPIKTWLSVLKALPTTRKPLYLGSWSLTAAVCAVAVVGGQMYWIDHMRKRALQKGPGGTEVVTIKRQLGLEKNWEDSIEDFTNVVVEVVDAPADLEPKPEDLDFDRDDERTPFGLPRVSQRFRVVGYVGRPNQVFSSLVLAQETPGNLVYAGMVGRGFSFSDRKQTFKKAAKPSVSAPGVSAVWVEPTLNCQVEYAYIDSQGLIVDPVFKGW